jgi:hypothetical protein
LALLAHGLAIPGAGLAGVLQGSFSVEQVHPKGARPGRLQWSRSRYAVIFHAAGGD